MPRRGGAQLRNDVLVLECDFFPAKGGVGPPVSAARGATSAWPGLRLPAWPAWPLSGHQCGRFWDECQKYDHRSRGFQLGGLVEAWGARCAEGEARWALMPSLLL